MKIAALFLLLAGWLLVLSAVVMLRVETARGAFALAGVAVEAVGLVLLFRTHLVHRGRHP